MAHWDDADPTRTFDGRAELYERGRPGYPRAVVDFLLHGLGEPSSVRVADVGAGTALLARKFVEAGCQVVAVEPNAEMRRAAPAIWGLRWRETTAEETGLGSDSLDLVTIAQALHWLEPERAFSELQRILVPRGRLAVIWNDRLRDSPFEAEYHRLLRELKPPDRRDSPPKAAIEILHGTPWFEDPELRTFRHLHRMDAAALIARTLSLSYAPTSGGKRDSLVERLRVLHDDHREEDGRVELGYSTAVHLTHAKA